MWQARQLRAQALQHDYDVPAWEQLADDLKAVPAINDDVRAAYEEFLAVMPSAVSGDEVDQDIVDSGPYHGLAQPLASLYNGLAQPLIMGSKQAGVAAEHHHAGWPLLHGYLTSM
jgi:hypothetical protein